MRRFAAQSRAAWMVVIDGHRDLGFGSHPHIMAKTAALIAARLGWEALILGEAVGLTVLGARRWIYRRAGAPPSVANLRPPGRRWRGDGGRR